MTKQRGRKALSTDEIQFDSTKGRPGIWVCKDGTEYAVKDLTDGHIKNILNLFFACTEFKFGLGVGPLRVMENAAYQIHKRPPLIEVVEEAARRRLVPGKYLSFLLLMKHEVMLQQGLGQKRGRKPAPVLLHIRLGSEAQAKIRRSKAA